MDKPPFHLNASSIIVNISINASELLSWGREFETTNHVTPQSQVIYWQKYRDKSPLIVSYFCHYARHLVRGFKFQNIMNGFGHNYFFSAEFFLYRTFLTAATTDHTR